MGIDVFSVASVLSGDMLSRKEAKRLKNIPYKCPQCNKNLVVQRIGSDVGCIVYIVCLENKMDEIHFFVDITDYDCW